MDEQTKAELSCPALSRHLDAGAANPRAYLGEDDVDDLIEAFEDADANGDGQLTRAELDEALATIEIPNPERAALERGLESTGGQPVSLERVLAMRAQAKIRAHAEVVHGSFTSVDLDGNGLVDLDELAAFVKGSGSGDVEAEVGRILAAIDKNGDRQISFDEFLGYNLSMTFDRHELRSSAGL